MTQFNETALFAGVAQSVSTSGTSAQTTNGVASTTDGVLLFCNEAVHIKIGVNPTATTSDFMLPASTALAFRVNPGDKVAGIQVSASGTLWVSEWKV